eukprot:TRINITY_DN1760_c0_g1_i1.p1 TRINITY_DN1760_c0_g1~~TRINITY_DN1760_c0_g1_i1.p1  ORF type:complete len:207 (-),score=45.39 TRINITY_DN1760_c0_g1_i1:30-650(-)
MLESAQKHQDRTGAIKWELVIADLKNNQHCVSLNPHDTKHVAKIKRKYSELKKKYYNKVESETQNGLLEDQIDLTDNEVLVKAIEDKRLIDSSREMHEKEVFESKLKEESNEKREQKRRKFESIVESQQQEQQLTNKLLDKMEEAQTKAIQEGKFEDSFDKLIKLWTIQIMSKNPEMAPALISFLGVNQAITHFSKFQLKEFTIIK